GRASLLLIRTDRHLVKFQGHRYHTQEHTDQNTPRGALKTMVKIYAQNDGQHHRSCHFDANTRQLCIFVELKGVFHPALPALASVDLAVIGLTLAVASRITQRPSKTAPSSMFSDFVKISPSTSQPVRKLSFLLRFS